MLGCRLNVKKHYKTTKNRAIKKPVILISMKKTHEEALVLFLRQLFEKTTDTRKKRC